MTTRSATQRLLVAAAGAGLAAAVWTSACGGGGNSGGTPANPTPPPTTPGTATPVTVTVTASGISSASPRVSVGSRIRFTNNDSRAHQFLSTPHLMHTDCPALNEIDTLSPGQSKDSGPLTEVRGCGFHDHLNPDNNAFRGQVLVGITESEPTPPTPGY